jgi:hypothetical protein
VLIHEQQGAARSWAAEPRMALFEHVVRREPAFSAFDVRTEADSERWLEADRLFGFHFPLFLSELLDDARGGTSNTVLAEWAQVAAAARRRLAPRPDLDRGRWGVCCRYGAQAAVASVRARRRRGALTCSSRATT